MATKKKTSKKTSRGDIPWNAATQSYTTTESIADLLRVGNIVIIRTAIYHALGRVHGFVAYGGVAFVRLSSAAYLGDTGRYSDATSRPIHEVTAAEVERVGLGGMLEIQIGSIGDIALAPEVARETR